jgi:hypothetical protein
MSQGFLGVLRESFPLFAVNIFFPQNKCGRASHPTASFVVSCLPSRRLASK